MKRYEWNDIGVCTNPDRETIRVDGRHELVVLCAQKPDGTWVYGRHFTNGSAYHGSPVSKSANGWITERVAKLNALLEAGDEIDRLLMNR
jgi:hypothetical protein